MTQQHTDLEVIQVDGPKKTPEEVDPVNTVFGRIMQSDDIRRERMVKLREERQARRELTGQYIYSRNKLLETIRPMANPHTKLSKPLTDHTPINTDPQFTPPPHRPAPAPWLEPHPDAEERPDTALLFSLTPPPDPNETAPNPQNSFPPTATADQITGQNQKGLFHRAFGEERLTLEDLLPERIKVAWRLTREMARRHRAIEPDQTLSELINDEENDPWTDANLRAKHLAQDGRTVRNGKFTAGETAMILEESWLMDPQDYPPEERRKGGLPLLPPALPERMIDPVTGNPVADYHPDGDVLLQLYLAMLDRCAMDLNILGGSLEDPEYGRYGMSGLDTTDYLRIAFPGRFQIAAFEEIVVSETLDLLITKGFQATRKKLRDRWGLQPHEIDDVVKIAMNQSRIRATNDIDEEKGLMIMRLEDFMLRCKDSLDKRNEMGAIKQMAIIMGMAKVEAKDSIKEFVDIVKSVAASRRPRLTNVVQQPALEASE